MPSQEHFDGRPRPTAARDDSATLKRPTLPVLREVTSRLSYRKLLKGGAAEPTLRMESVNVGYQAEVSGAPQRQWLRCGAWERGGRRPSRRLVDVIEAEIRRRG